MTRIKPPIGPAAVFLLALLVGGACQTAPGAPPAGVTEYFPPDAFLHGFRVTPPRIARRIPLTDFGRLAPMVPTNHEPFWTLVQWHCVESLSDAHRTAFSPREAVWENRFQKLRVLVGDAGRPELNMTIDSLAIYNQSQISYATMCRVRPHLLLSHSFYPDRDGVRRYGGAEEPDTTPDGTTLPDLDTFSELTLSMRLRLAEAADLREAYRGDIPANRRNHYNRIPFQFWFRVYCRNPDDAAHGRFFWLGCRVYNNDYPHTSNLGRQRDQIESDGNATFAYRLSDLSIHGPDYEEKVEGLFAGKETSITLDVLDAARTAVRTIQDQKKDFLHAPPDLAGYTLSSFNIGWEPASPVRVTMVIKGLSLRGVRQ